MRSSFTDEPRSLPLFAIQTPAWSRRFGFAADTDASGYRADYNW
jgi:hypothetical protein